jgi:lipopolysaccharide export system permease protein
MNVMIPLTLARYFALRFLGATFTVFGGVFVLVVLVDYVELTRRAADVNVSALVVAQTSLFRVPQATERMLPFAVLVGAMACYLNLSRRLELVIARAAGMSAWQFVAPAVIVAILLGSVVTTAYNPLSTALRERSKRLESELFGERPSGLVQLGGGFWVRQRSADGREAILFATASRDQGGQLDGVTIFTYDPSGRFEERIEARTAILEAGHWRLGQVRLYATGKPPRDLDSYLLSTSLTSAEVQDSFATPETVSFWQLPFYISKAEQAGLGASGYRLQYQLLLAEPFLLASMVLLASSVSLRFFRFGGVPKMVLSGVGAGFLLYILSKVTGDLSKAELMHPGAAAWVPVLFGVVTGLVVLLYQEDG